MPLFWKDDDPIKKAFADVAGQLRLEPQSVTGILVISAHWEAENDLEVTLQEGNQKLLYDYGGFPKESYQLDDRYHPPGSPAISKRVLELLQAAGLKAKANPSRKLDHGVFIPMMLLKGLGDLDLPVVQLALPSERATGSWSCMAGVSKGDARKDWAARCIELGRVLQPLRKEGILIIGSGQATHAIGQTSAHIEAFMSALTPALCEEPEKRTQVLGSWWTLPSAVESTSREEHLLPLHVAAAAADGEPGQVLGDGRFMGFLAMTHYAFGA